MRNLVISLIILLAASCAFVGPNYYYKETMKVDLDNPDRWSHVITQRSNGRSLSEKVPKGQSLTNWKEIVTFQFYAKEVDSYSISQHLGTKEKVLRNVCPNIKFEVTYQDLSEVRYQWAISGCANHADQFAIAKFIKTGQGIHHIAYEKRTIMKVKAEWENWRRIIDSAYVVEI